ncbi:unnamed protein product [Chrysoparadoxa australica]
MRDVQQVNEVPKSHSHFPSLLSQMHAVEQHSILLEEDVDVGDDKRVREGGDGKKPFSPMLLLASVPLVWGTYGPSVKRMYDMSASAPPGLFFNLACYMVAAPSLWLGALIAKNNRKVSAPTGGGDVGHVWLKPSVELGLWLFLGSSFQVAGLRLTTAASAGFIVQLTTVLVPCLESLVGGRALPKGVKTAVGLAALGVAIIASDGIGGGELTRSRLFGDGLVALSALFWSIHTIRLSKLAAGADALVLAAAQTTFQLLFAIVGFLFSADMFQEGIACLSQSGGLFGVFAATVLWNGVVTTAWPMFAQTYGQGCVKATEANLIYSLQPLWSAFFACVLVHEAITKSIIIGGSCLLMAVYLASHESQENQEEEKIKET